MAAASSVWSSADLSSYAGPLLLDTHIWVWHLEGDTNHMTPELIALLGRCNSAGQLHVSDISYWEVAVKTAKAKLVLSIDAGIWLKRAAQAPGIRLLPLHRDILLLSTRLAGTVHNDRADRMLIAAAVLNNLPLVTADRLIVEYALEHPGTPVVDARM
ncbi:MAG TPA: type II toxin-antitoxin system VapC family toxin [Longimicrobiales bacterium]|nr:type II toxin-antitoxin system VapC family toxin [Longimicrobiales bacterium]